jgi:hypothetical protein
MQRDMFWADQLVSSEFVGFLDTDSLFSTHVLPRDIFEARKPMVLGSYGNLRDSEGAVVRVCVCVCVCVRVCLYEVRRMCVLRTWMYPLTCP